MNMKIDTGSDTVILTSDNLQILPISIDLQPSDSILKGYGESRIENLGVTTLMEKKSVETKFHVVEPSGNPSMIGCNQAQDLGIITVNVNDLNSAPTDLKSATSRKQW